MTPVIGITCYVEPAHWGVWDVPAALLPHAYVEAVAKAGGLPVLIPPSGAVLPDVVLQRLDGLMLAGGADIDPAKYGAAPHPQTAGVRGDRDGAELPLATAALERNLPVLGICRGAQVLNVARGGSLVQHLPDAVGHEGHRPEPGVYGTHRVRFTEGSRLASILNESSIVRSYHHQGIGRLGAGLMATAWAEDDSIEGLEDPTLTFAIGTLWHPEVSEDGRIFDAFIAAAAG